MNNDQRICYGCMSIIPKDTKACPHCSFDNASFSQNPRCLIPGTTLNDEKYVVGKVIGEGGFGITYIGWDTQKEQPVAIKEYFPSRIASRDCTKGDSNDIYFFDKNNESQYKVGFHKYIREAKTLQQFSDLEGIVSILDFIYENNTAYIIMEYVEGITLKEYLDTNGTLSPKDTFELMMPVMLALEKVHEKGIIHRDISPDNIMIRLDGAFKLIDFGAARLSNDENGMSLTIILKRGFAPEEQYRTHGLQGSWTDVYALCATMYKTITNAVPPEAMDRLMEDNLVPLSDYQIDIQKHQVSAISKGLQVHAKDRFQTVKELRLALTTEEAPVLDQELHMIATFQENDGTVVGYRLINKDSGETTDISPEELIESIQSDRLKVNNLIVYQHYVQPVGGSIRRYPVLAKNGTFRYNDHLYFVEHSISSGYLCFNYNGESIYCDDVQIQKLLTEQKIANEDKIGLFLTHHNKEDYHSFEIDPPFVPPLELDPIIPPVEESKEEAPPVKKKKKLSLKTDYSEPLAADNTVNKNISKQLRLKLINESKKLF